MVLEYIAKYIAEHFEFDSEDVTKETTFEEIGAYEEDMMDMLFDLSREFDFIADEEDLDSMEDVGAMVDYVERNIEENNGTV